MPVLLPEQPASSLHCTHPTRLPDWSGQQYLLHVLLASSLDFTVCVSMSVSVTIVSVCPLHLALMFTCAISYGSIHTAIFYQHDQTRHCQGQTAPQPSAATARHLHPH